MAQRAFQLPASTLAPAQLYDVGSGWLHRVHPLTKLAAILPVSVLGFVLPVPYAAGLLAALVLAIAASRTVRPLLQAGLLILPISLALFIIRAVVAPSRGDALVTLGPLEIGSDGLAAAAAVAVRLAVFVVAITAVMATTHPKVLATALIERGVSHKLAYAYLAGVELVPEMRARAHAILDAQRSRGFDPRFSVTMRIRGLGLLLKPLLLGAVISAETRTLALEARGFSIRGPRTSTAEVPTGGDWPALRMLFALLAVALIAWKVAATWI
jgi:energy-coupling factor transport system permease protein